MKNISRRDAFRVLAGAPLAMAGTAALAQQPIAHSHDPDLAAKTHGLAKKNNIGIVMTYGTGNGSTPDEVATFLTDKLNDRLEALKQEDPTITIEDINVEYYLAGMEKDGISIAYSMGGLAVGPVDITEAFTDETLTEVLRTRDSTARLLAAAENDQPVLGQGS